MTSIITKGQVMNILSTCNDPELGINIVDLGLVYGITITEETVTILLTLTTPGCPLMPYFKEELTRKVLEGTGIGQVEISLTFDPPWNPDKMSQAAQAQLTMMR